VTSPDDLRALASIVGDLEANGLDIEEAHVLDSPEDGLRADLTVTVPVQEIDFLTGDGVSGSSLWADSEPVDESDDLGDSSNSERDDETDGLSGTDNYSVQHLADVRADLTDLQTEVVDAIVVHGEQPASELETITGQGRSIYERLSTLADKGIVATRDDPDDGRRSLYSLAVNFEREGLQDEEPDHRIGDELADEDLEEPSTDGGAVATDPDEDRDDWNEVHDVLDDLGEQPYLGEVADQLGVTEGRARTQLVDADRYSEVIVASKSKFRGRDE